MHSLIPSIIDETDNVKIVYINCNKNNNKSFLHCREISLSALPGNFSFCMAAATNATCLRRPDVLAVLLHRHNGNTMRLVAVPAVSIPHPFSGFNLVVVESSHAHIRSLKAKVLRINTAQKITVFVCF